MSEPIGHLVDQLRASDVHAVHDGVLLGAQDAVGLTARLQHVRLDVLLHHQADLLQQGVQVLLHAPGAVHVQVEELRDLQQVGHLFGVCLVLRGNRSDNIDSEGAGSHFIKPTWKELDRSVLTLDSSMGRAMMKCSVSLFLSSI